MDIYDIDRDVYCNISKKGNWKLIVHLAQKNFKMAVFYSHDTGILLGYKNMQHTCKTLPIKLPKSERTNVNKRWSSVNSPMLSLVE